MGEGRARQARALLQRLPEGGGAGIAERVVEQHERAHAPRARQRRRRVAVDGCSTGAAGGNAAGASQRATGKKQAMAPFKVKS